MDESRAEPGSLTCDLRLRAMVLLDLALGTEPEAVVRAYERLVRAVSEQADTGTTSHSDQRGEVRQQGRRRNAAPDHAPEPYEVWSGLAAKLRRRAIELSDAPLCASLRRIARKYEELARACAEGRFDGAELTAIMIDDVAPA